ncbi:MAG: hypothetical protein FJ267_07930 [Planctomycetes bacterium]|nr:hypothetical protein [Planctomycetota bacterium]
MTTIELNHDNQKFLEDSLAQGEYRSPDELLNEAVSQLRRYRDLMTHIEEGTQQLRDGRYIEVNAEGLRSFFDDIKARGRARVAAEKPTS